MTRLLSICEDHLQFTMSKNTNPTVAAQRFAACSELGKDFILSIMRAQIAPPPALDPGDNKGSIVIHSLSSVPTKDILMNWDSRKTSSPSMLGLPYHDIDNEGSRAEAFQRATVWHGIASIVVGLDESTEIVAQDGASSGAILMDTIHTKQRFAAAKAVMGESSC